MKRFYADYVTHCLKYYAMHQEEQRFRSHVDEMNWTAVDRVLERIPAEHAELILDIYSTPVGVGEAVAIAAAAHEIHEKVVWSVVKKVESMVARERDLI